MGGRYAGGVEDYPEHLNPFREDGDDRDDSRRSKLATLGRRKLRAVLNLTSWTLFPWRKSKGVEDSNGSGRNRFLTMTPKLSRHIIERLSKRKPRSASLAPASNPATSTGKEFSYTEFRIMPKSSREKFAVRPTREKQEDVLEGSYLWADRSSVPDLALSSTSTSPVSEVCADEDLRMTEPRYAKQGAKPKKKRPAPPPPASASGTPADHKHVNTTAETEESLASPTPPSPASKNNDASFHESPPGSPTSNDSASLCGTMATSNITCALVHEPSPVSNHINDPTQETSITSNNIDASTHETSTTPSNISDSTYETPIISNNINASIIETSLTSDISVSTHETSTTSETISASNHETSITSNTVSASNHETSTTSNINASAHDNLPASPTAKNLTVSVQEMPQTSNDVSDTVHETNLETSTNLTPLNGENHKEVTPTACKL